MKNNKVLISALLFLVGAFASTGLISVALSGIAFLLAAAVIYDVTVELKLEKTEDK